MRKKPDVVEFIDSEYFDITEKYNTEENEFMMAVSVERHKMGARMDLRYV